VDNLSDQVVELTNESTDEVRSSLGLTLIANVENYTYTGTKAQTFTDTDLGDHRITAGSGADTLASGSGNDTLSGGAGADALDGGAGNDTYVIDNAKDAISDSSGTDTVQSTLSVDLHLPAFAAIENVQLLGATAINAIGRDDPNRLEGNAGANKLIGNGGDDTMIGNAGNDSLEGGSGNDVLDGGAGADKLTGGADADTFLRHSLAEGKDTITDFRTGAGGDVLDIADLLIGYSAGHQAEFAQCVSAGGNTTVKVDADGLANGSKFTDVCVLTGVATDLTTLVNDGNLSLAP
jgi:Ca2+-binding RTX toxin-like protein